MYWILVGLMEVMVVAVVQMEEAPVEAQLLMEASEMFVSKWQLPTCHSLLQEKHQPAEYRHKSQGCELQPDWLHCRWR